jgi:hypothetical protein
MAVTIALAAACLLTRPEQRRAPGPFIRAAQSTAADRQADPADQEPHSGGREHTDAV